MRIQTLAVVFVSLLFAIQAFSFESAEGSWDGGIPKVKQGFDLINLKRPEIPDLPGNILISSMMTKDEVTFDRTATSNDMMSSILPHVEGASRYYEIQPPTKASDIENNDEFGNGSKVITPKDTVQGSLLYDTSQPGDSDLIDWYKLALTDIDPTPNAVNGARNVSITLNSFTDGSGGYTLYEFALNDKNLSDDYADFLDIMMVYVDPSTDLVFNLGGWAFLYDDMDDSDGWSWSVNWSFDFVPPVPSTGTEDSDGRANGLTERGWYYIGLYLDGYMKNGAPVRGSFDINYDITVDSSRKQNTDPGSNIVDSAGTLIPDQVYRISSNYNDIDWFKVEGSDPSKLWNMSFVISWTGYGGEVVLPPLQNFYYDPFLNFFFMFFSWGNDQTWGTGDDQWVIYWRTFSLYMTGGRYINQADQSLMINLGNTCPFPDKKMVYIGFYSEPMTIYYDGVDDPLFLIANWFALSEYKVHFSIAEESPNRAPQITQIKYSSDWAADKNGGNLDSVFTFDVTYSDPDNDPPETLFLQIDPDTAEQKEYDLLIKEVNKADKKYSDGKDYRLTLTGEQIGEGVHDYSVKTNDSIPIESLRTSITSGPFYRNDTLKVWDDQPVVADPDWKGVPSIAEDDPPVDVQVLTLGSVHGPFMDVEDTIRSVKIWDDGSQSWADRTTGTVVEVEIIDDGGFIARITTIADMSGKDTIKLKATDDHSSAERSFDVKVDPVNDLPVILSLEKGGKEYTVTKTDSGIYMADMKDDWIVYEDKELEFSIIATDVDLSGSFVYKYIADISDSWDNDPTVDPSGMVMMTPRDQDMKRNLMAFSVGDGTGTVQLRIEVKVSNTNDPPTLAFRVPPKTEYSQGDKISMGPKGDDPDLDSGDKLTYSVNMENDFGKAYPSIMDQLGLSDIAGNLWTIDLKTGDFFFDLKEQSIWGYGPGREKEKKITVAFKVMDLAGLSTIKAVELTLTDVNEGPSAPELIYSEVILEDVDPSTPYLKEYQKVHLWVRPASDPDGDVLVYTWDLGDGKQLTGIDVNYTYSSPGTRTVRVWASDGEFETEVISSDVRTYTEVIERPPPPEENGPPVLLIVIIAIVVLAIIAGIVLFAIRSKPKAPPRA